MIKRYNSISLALGAPGLAVQIGGYGTAMVGISTGHVRTCFIGTCVCLVGTALLFAGLAYYAKAKARHPAES